ncbi:MAG: hypothetical protein HOF35_03275 [Bacteroidetes bacterium]|nr:hypothetical protein [Bacteroidota bacterium]
MPLQKGFLKSQFKINDIPRLRFWAGIIIGLFTAIAFYYFAIGIRESIRYWAILLLDYLWKWNSEDVMFYNIVYALFAGIFGQTVCLEIWFSGNTKSFWKKTRLRSHQVVVDQKLFSWYFIWFLFKTGFLFGFFCSAWVLFVYIDLKESFENLFWLLLVNYFFFSWMNISRRFKNPWKLMLAFLISISILSAALININLISHTEINNAYKQVDVKSNYQINIPYAKNSNSINYYYFNEFYLFDYNKEMKMIAGDSLIAELGISKYLQQCLTSSSTRPWRNEGVMLSVDSNTSMKHILQFENELRYNSFFNIYFMVQNIDYKNLYPGHFTNLGLYHKIDPYLPDSINNTRPIPPPPSLFNPWLEDYCFFKIGLNAQNKFVVNDSLYTLAHLSNAYWDFVVQHENDGMLVIDIDDTAIYYRYIQLLDMVAGTHNKLRELVSESDYSYRFQKLIIRQLYFDYLQSAQKDIQWSFEPNE